MLQFYYDCLLQYLPRSSFELIEMDTDSLYMALNRPSLEDCVKLNKKDEFKSDIYHKCDNSLNAKWFPRKCCDKHIALDRRYCGIFGLEFKGSKMIALCSKSNIIENETGKQKISCKGVSKRSLMSPMSKYEDTLFNQKLNFSTNKGFRLKNGEMCTYEQNKIGFNYFYVKREVLADGIHTKPLQICLSPWEYQYHIINQIQNPLSNLYNCNIFYDNILFNSSEQMYFYLYAQYCKNKILMEKVLTSTDSLELIHLFTTIIEPKGWVNVKVEKMRQALFQKWKQCDEFRSTISSIKDILIYKQSNFSKNDILFWSVNHPDRLIKVLSVDSMIGNNKMGMLLMEFSNKT